MRERIEEECDVSKDFETPSDFPTHSSFQEHSIDKENTLEDEMQSPFKTALFWPKPIEKKIRENLKKKYPQWLRRRSG